MSIAAPMHAAAPWARATTPVVATTPVTVYATWWNLSGHRIRLALDRAGVACRSIDVGMHPEAASVLPDLAARGGPRLPLVDVDGEWMMSPTPEEVTSALRRHDLLPRTAS